jgi:hypothetical protein
VADHKAGTVQVRPAADVEATVPPTVPQVPEVAVVPVAPTTAPATAKPLDQRVTQVEQRVDKLENPPTTTTTYWMDNPNEVKPTVITAPPFHPTTTTIVP